MQAKNGSKTPIDYRREMGGMEMVPLDGKKIFIESDNGLKTLIESIDPVNGDVQIYATSSFPGGRKVMTPQFTCKSEREITELTVDMIKHMEKYDEVSVESSYLTSPGWDKFEPNGLIQTRIKAALDGFDTIRGLDDGKVGLDGKIKYGDIEKIADGSIGDYLKLCIESEVKLTGWSRDERLSKSYDIDFEAKRNESGYMVIISDYAEDQIFNPRQDRRISEFRIQCENIDEAIVIAKDLGNAIESKQIRFYDLEPFIESEKEKIDDIRMINEICEESGGSINIDRAKYDRELVDD